jgi:hypothetical protein
VGSYNIEIPHPVIEVEVEYEPATSHNEDSRWFARVEVGGVVLMKREYDADWRDYTTRPDNFAEDADEARQMILKDFGTAIKNLLEGETK